MADLGEHDGSEQRGERPVMIVQNDTGNLHSPTTIVASITASKKRYMPTHLRVDREIQRMHWNSKVLFEQIHTIDKSKLRDCIAILPEHLMQEADDLLKLSLGLATLEEVKQWSRERFQSRAAR